MRTWLESLRGRLAVSMLLVFVLGLGGAMALRPLEEHLARSRPFGLLLLREPYQDISTFLLIGLCAVALIGTISRWSLRHLDAASRDAVAIDASNPNVRLSLRRLPAEIRPLVEAVNGALDRLADAYTTEQRFVADAAHELRTPLAVLTLRLQRAKLDGHLDWPAVERDMAEVNRLAGQLLDLARKERVRQAGRPNDTTRINLSRVAREAAAGIVPLVENAGRQIEVDLPASIPIRGRAFDLQDMLRNLLENALVHGEGTIRISGEVLSAASGFKHAQLTVSDDGEGIPESVRGAIFERFRKGKSESCGSGLGLAIVREVVLAHDGTVEILPGPGCRVRVALCVADGEANLIPEQQIRRAGARSAQSEAQG